MHQPPGNLELLIESSPQEAERIVRCYERAARYAAQYVDQARLHLGFSGILLEQLLTPAVVDAYRHILDIPEMLGRLSETPNLEFVGMGHYHPIFPLIPKADWEEQLSLGRSIVERAFGRPPRGFWPSEMAFSMEMIPSLVKTGYEYVVVDAVHVRPRDGLNDIYRPYLACHEGVCISVVPRDRALSGAQARELDPDLFGAETHERVQGSPRPDQVRLVTTWSDGENGDWFRRLDEEQGFFGRFFANYMEQARAGVLPVVPVSLSHYLEQHRPTSHARVQTGSWSPGAAPGQEFSRWIGSESQRKAADLVRDLSRRFWELERRRTDLGDTGRQALAKARTLILESQTSCFLFWGESWIPYLHQRTAAADRELAQATADFRPPEDAV